MFSNFNYCINTSFVIIALVQGMEVVHEPSESNQTEPESTVSTDFSLDGSSKLVDTDMDSPDAEERYPCGSTMSSHEDCSTSGVYRHKASKFLQRNHIRGTGERNKRKRWRGRDDSSPQDLKATKLVNASMSEEQQVSYDLFWNNYSGEWILTHFCTAGF